MPVRIPVAHDFNCGWCWIAVSQVTRLTQEFDVEFDWLSYELFPPELEWPEGSAATATSSRPKTPSRFELALAAEGLGPVRKDLPKRMRTTNAHQAVHFAKSLGKGDELLVHLYRKYWLEAYNINDIQFLVSELVLFGAEEVLAREAIEGRMHRNQVVNFDDDAYASGVFNVPTFWIDGERYAEQPTTVLRDSIQRIAPRRTATSAHLNLRIGAAFPDRPRVLINMVSTIDGKIITGERDEPVQDLGSKVDHNTLRLLESSCDAIMIGAGTVRATPKMTFRRGLKRFIVTQSGKLNPDQLVFTEDSENTFVLKPKNAPAPHGVQTLSFGDDELDFHSAMLYIRQELGVQSLLCEGGSELNAELFSRDAVDEIFLTIAPKIKLGRAVPTLAGGEPLPRPQIKNFELIACETIGSEVFLRYERKRA